MINLGYQTLDHSSHEKAELYIISPYEEATLKTKPKDIKTLVSNSLATRKYWLSNYRGSGQMPSEVSEWAKGKEEDILNEAIKAKEQIERALPTDRTDTISNFLGDVAGQQIFIIGSAVLGGVPATMLAGYSMSFSEMYSEARDNGLSHDDAMLLSRTYGAISAPLEMLGAGPVIKKVVGKKIRKEIIDKIRNKQN